MAASRAWGVVVLIVAAAGLAGCASVRKLPNQAPEPAPAPPPLPSTAPAPAIIPTPRTPLPTPKMSPPTMPSRTMLVPPDRVPPAGSCRIWLADVPAERQPPPMSCHKAHADAARWGGSVVWPIDASASREGRVATRPYGPHTLRGVPPDRLPAPGTCKLWNDKAPPEQQAPAVDCRSAQEQQAREGGRVLYMPGSDRGP
jgi:hypothetical protein